MLQIPTSFESERLRLRKPLLEDAAAIFEGYAADPEVTRYLLWAPHRSVADTRGFLARCLSVWELGSAYPYIIERREDGQLLGMIEMRVTDFAVDLGYVLARPSWGQGIMSEAARALVEWAIAQPGIYRVWAYCDVDNGASARVMEKAGMEYEGTLRRYSRHPNASDEPRDVLVYARVKG